MAHRSAALLSALAVGALGITGCGLLPAAPPTETSSPSAVITPSSTPTGVASVELPEDAVLGLTATATAANGAILNISVVVLQSAPWDSGVGTPRSSTTQTRCSGEVEASIFHSGNWSFGQVDVTATLAEGSTAWPDDLPMQILPLPDSASAGPSHASSGDVVQVEAPAPDGAEAGYYVAHCAQNTFLNAPGSGSVYLGFEGDAQALTAWASSYYGITFDGFGEPTDPELVTLTDCTQQVTPLGTASGAPAGGFNEFYFTTFCHVGGL